MTTPVEQSQQQVPAPQFIAPQPQAQQPERPAEPQKSKDPEPTLDASKPEWDGEFDPQRAWDKIKDSNREAAALRARLKEYEEREQAAREADMTELQRAQERAAQYEKDLTDERQKTQLLGFAAKYGIPEDDYDLLGSGTPEEMESRAVRIAHMREAAIGQQPTTPPSNRPVESLRPGASPQPPVRADNSYPEAWRPRTRETS